MANFWDYSCTYMVLLFESFGANEVEFDGQIGPIKNGDPTKA